MMHSNHIPPESRQARRLLAHNAIFTGACALPMVIASGVIARAVLFSKDGAVIVSVIGFVLLGYAAALLFARTQAPDKLRRWLLTFSAADAVWVLSTALLLLAMPAAFTPVGQAVAVVIAVVVGWFGIRQLLAGLGR